MFESLRKDGQGVWHDVCSVFDKKALVYGPLFLKRNKGEAIRFLADLASEPGSLVNKHASDFAMYKIGSFDSVSGEFKKCDRPEFIAEALDFRPVSIEPEKALSNGGR